MTNTILLSCTPKECELIFNGKQTLLPRKSLPPKISAPFTVLIYCNKAKNKSLNSLYQLPDRAELYRGYSKMNEEFILQEANFLDGKVIGSFTCHNLSHYASEFWDDSTYESISELYEPLDFSESGEYENYCLGVNGECNHHGDEFFDKACMTWQELRNYIGTGLRQFYGYGITRATLFDRPRQVSEYRSPCTRDIHCAGCSYGEITQKQDYIEIICNRPQLSRPPQSWCYVEGVSQ